MNPTVVTTHSGTYAVSGSTWLSVPQGTKITDLDWVDTTPKIKRYKLQTWKVESTSRKKPGKVNKYTVKFDGLYSCTCSVQYRSTSTAFNFYMSLKLTSKKHFYEPRSGAKRF